MNIVILQGARKSIFTDLQMDPLFHGDELKTSIRPVREIRCRRPFHRAQGPPLLMINIQSSIVNNQSKRRPLIHILGK